MLQFASGPSFQGRSRQELRAANERSRRAERAAGAALNEHPQGRLGNGAAQQDIYQSFRESQLLVLALDFAEACRWRRENVQA